MLQEIEYIKQFPQPDNFDHSEEKWNKNFNDSFVVINCFSKNIYYPEHWTPLSIKCAFGGKEHYRFSNKTYSISDQSFLMLNEGNVYSSYIYSDTEVESLSLNFTSKNIETLKAVYQQDEVILNDPFTPGEGNLNFYDKIYEYTPQFLSYINLFREQLQQTKVDRNILNELMYLSLAEMVQFNKNTSSEINRVDAKKRSTREELYKRLCIAKDHMYSCYHENVPLDKLASISLLNPAYLLREFKKLFNCTPHQYLTGIRLGHAKKLITDTDKPISEIVTETGFMDLSSFSKLFKRNYDISPQAYRMQAKKKKCFTGNDLHTPLHHPVLPV